MAKNGSLAIFARRVYCDDIWTGEKLHKIHRSPFIVTDKDDVGRRCLPPEEQLKDTVNDELTRAGIGILYKELQICRVVRNG